MHDVASRGSPRAHIRQATFELDHDLYRAIRVEAARADRPVREVVQEALEAWLARAEELEDRDSAAAALAEYQQDGGEAAEAWFGRLAAETQASYGSEPTGRGPQARWRSPSRRRAP
jgi:plasmid stability protein